MIAGALLGSWVTVGIAVSGWSSEARYSVPAPYILAAQKAIGRAVAHVPPSRPVIVAVDGPNDRVIAKQETLIRMALPADRISDVRFYVGSLSGLARGVVQPTGVRERDRLARSHWPEIRPLLAQNPLMLGVSNHGAPAGWQRVGSHVYVHGTTSAMPTRGGGRASLPDPSPSPWWPFALVPAMLLGVILVGWPLARWFVGAGDWTTVLGLSPALGLGILMYASVVVDAAGADPVSSAGRIGLVLAVVGIALAPNVKVAIPQTR